MLDTVALTAHLKHRCELMQLDLNNAQYEQLIAYLQLMMKWNKSFNLSAIRDPFEAVDKHLVDSLSLMPLISQNTRYLDIGSGAGLPGIPLSITFPNSSFIMVDSNGKKTRFIQQAILSLKLNNASVIHSRIEQLPATVEFDIVMARALGTLRQMLEWLGDRVIGGRQLLAMKGVYPQQEIEELPENFIVSDVVAMEVAGLEAQRHAIWVQRNNE